MRINALAAAGLTLTLGAAATADVVIDLDNFVAAGFEYSLFYGAGELTGTLTSVVIEAVLVEAGLDFTWASDLSVLVSTDTLDPPYWAQIGGFSVVGGVLEYTDGLNGFSGNAGTIVSYAYDLFTPLEIDDKAIWIGNGYSFGGDGVWSGSITLKGVSLAEIPAPGALALLGLAGVIVRRRRD